MSSRITDQSLEGLLEVIKQMTVEEIPADFTLRQLGFIVDLIHDEQDRRRQEQEIAFAIEDIENNIKPAVGGKSLDLALDALRYHYQAKNGIRITKVREDEHGVTFEIDTKKIMTHTDAIDWLLDVRKRAEARIEQAKRNGNVAINFLPSIKDIAACDISIDSIRKVGQMQELIKENMRLSEQYEHDTIYFHNKWMEAEKLLGMHHGKCNCDLCAGTRQMSESDKQILKGLHDDRLSE